MVAKLILTGSSNSTEGVIATILDGGQIQEITLSDTEAHMSFPELAKKRGWERPTDADMDLYRELRGPGPTITYGEGVKEELTKFLRSLDRE